jgi:hypothetical protein
MHQADVAHGLLLLLVHLVARMGAGSTERRDIFTVPRGRRNSIEFAGAAEGRPQPPGFTIA